MALCHSYANFFLCISPTPLQRSGWETRSIFQRSKPCLNSNFSFSSTGCLTKAKEVSLLYSLPKVNGSTDGFMPFPRALAWSEKQINSSRIWTRVTDFISYNGNCYVKLASKPESSSSLSSCAKSTEFPNSLAIRL